MLIITFSKAFCSLGGALIANKEISRYVDVYAKCRTFSAAVPPSIIGGLQKILELAASEDGMRRRKRIIKNAQYMRKLLSQKVDILQTDSWIIPVLFRDEKMTWDVWDELQSEGMDASLICYPAVPKDYACARLFITSEHTKEQLKKASEIIFNVADKFGFLKK